jgi:hypothetical protein
VGALRRAVRRPHVTVLVVENCSFEIQTCVQISCTLSRYACTTSRAIFPYTTVLVFADRQCHCYRSSKKRTTRSSRVGPRDTTTKWFVSNISMEPSCHTRCSVSTLEPPLFSRTYTPVTRCRVARSEVQVGRRQGETPSATTPAAQGRQHPRPTTQRPYVHRPQVESFRPGYIAAEQGRDESDRPVAARTAPAESRLCSTVRVSGMPRRCEPGMSDERQRHASEVEPPAARRSREGARHVTGPATGAQRSQREIATDCGIPAQETLTACRPTEHHDRTRRPTFLAGGTTGGRDVRTAPVRAVEHATDRRTRRRSRG